MSKLSKTINVGKEVVVRGETIKIFPLTFEGALILDQISALKVTLTELKEKNEDRERSNLLSREVSVLSNALIKLFFKEENFTDEELKNMDYALFSELYSLIIASIEDVKEQNAGIRRIRELKEKAVSESR